MTKPIYRDTDLTLSVEGVTKSFDGFRAINDLNFYLGDGELRTVIGPNGAGKSTFMDLITGRTRPDEGTLTYHREDGRDFDLTKLREYETNRLGISRKFQTPSVYTQHSVYDNLVLSLNRDRGVWRALRYRETPADREEIESVLELVRLQDRRVQVRHSRTRGRHDGCRPVSALRQPQCEEGRRPLVDANMQTQQPVDVGLPEDQRKPRTS